MPVVVDPDSETLETLLTTVPAGAHGIDLPDRLQAWLANRPEEYVVVLGPQVELTAALALADGMRLSRPSTSVVLVRDEVDAMVHARRDARRHPRRRPAQGHRIDHARRSTAPTSSTSRCAAPAVRSTRAGS